ncbi:hypothetical protein BH24ACT20_BH24ACT20_03560 [soil metagenome]
MSQKTLLLVMVLAVPVMVGLSGLVSFLLLKMGYGVIVWAVLPFVGLLLLVGVLGIFLSRSAVRGERISGKGSKGD